MPTAEPAPEPAAAAFTAVVIEGGNEPWERIEPLLSLRLQELPPGGTLELRTSQVAVVAAAREWCPGRAVLDVEEGPDATCLRIANPHPNTSRRTA
jgi:hypothetical protein